MMLVAGGYAVFSLLGAAAESMPWLMAARMLLGMTIGLSATVTPVYIAESAPARLRGSLLVTYQVATILGIIGGYLSAFVLADSGSWRWMLGLAAVPALLVLPLLATMPDTARWYLFKNRVDDARKALLRVEPNRDVEQELAEIAEAMDEERGGTFIEMLRPPYLRATIFVVGLGFFAELSGINGIIYYSPLLFQAMGFRGQFRVARAACAGATGFAGRRTGLAVPRRPDRPPAHPAVRYRDNDPRRRGADRGIRRQVQRRLRIRIRRAADVHDGLHLRLRRAGLGLRR